MSRDPRQHLLLMSAVLDGEATPEEARELERLLREDSGARAEYDALRRFFARLQSVPRLDPPPGLADAASERFQLLNPPRVLGLGGESGKPQSPMPESIQRVPGNFPYGPPAKEKTMSQKVSKRALWIGAALAAAAVVTVGIFVHDFPASGKDVAGTVAPAQRYRAEQIKAEDVKLGDQAVTQLMQSEAFERIINDPKMRALALEPGFLALARQPDALINLANNLDSAIAMAKANSAQNNALANNAQNNALANNAQNNALANSAQNNALANNAQNNALANSAQNNALANNAQNNALQTLAMTPAAQQVLAQHANAFAQMARLPGFAAMAANPAFANALATNAAQNNAAQK